MNWIFYIVINDQIFDKCKNSILGISQVHYYNRFLGTENSKMELFFRSYLKTWKFNICCVKRISPKFRIGTEVVKKCLALLFSYCVFNTSMIVGVTSNPQFVSVKMITHDITSAIKIHPKVQLNANSLRWIYW